jgi:ferredoxin-thioredoxin reductase catalytic subunit
VTLQYKEIYPKIWVFKNPWEDIDLLTKTIIDSEQNPEGSALNWHGWYTFGKEADQFNHSATSSERTQLEKRFWDELIEIFNKTTNQYAETFGVPIDLDAQVFNEEDESMTQLWKRMGPSICKYEVDGGIEESDLAMHVHTDYQRDYHDFRGYKFTFTCTMYLNGDYEGGGLTFLVDNKTFYYKPEKGDVLLFPAGDPDFLSDAGQFYMHGVEKVKGTPKYFVRNHWVRFYPGSEEWLKNEKLYGKEIWKEMEIARTKEERKSGVYQTIDYEEVKKLERINLNDI